MKSNENIVSRRKPLQRYSSEVLSETLVTGVPNIVNTHYWPRKIFKLTVLLLCIIGFLYQTIEFLTLVYSYPSIVDITVYTPEEHLLPAIDICNNNGIVRSKFCQKYPERCEIPENRAEFCRENSQYFQYCQNDTEWEKFKVPKVEFYEFGKNASFSDMTELTHEEKSMFNIFPVIYSGEIDVKGPLIFFKSAVHYISCYTVHFRADGSEDPIKFPTNPLNSIFPSMVLLVDFELGETFLPGRKPEGLLTIHSPFEFVNPFERGIRIKPQKMYNIHITMTEEELLPLPYESDCRNYTREWLEEGRKGPRSQEMCKRICLYRMFVNACNCSVKALTYPYEEDICFVATEKDGCLNYLDTEEVALCLELCKDDCEKQKFSHVAEERIIEDSDWEGEEDKEQKKAYVRIYFSDPEVVVYKHRPRYETIEVFGYIGGYIGVWLGISLVAVIDFMECLFLIVSFAFRRRK